MTKWGLFKNIKEKKGVSEKKKTHVKGVLEN